MKHVLLTLSVGVLSQPCSSVVYFYFTYIHRSQQTLPHSLIFYPLLCLQVNLALPSLNDVLSERDSLVSFISKPFHSIEVAAKR